MEVDSDERRQSSDIGVLHAQSPSIVQISLVLSDAAASLELPPAFKIAQELTFTMLAHALQSTHDGPSSYVTILLTFLQLVLRHPEGLATLERAMPGQTSLHSLAKDHEYRPITPRARSSVRAASYWRTGRCVGWCGLDDFLSMDSGMAVRVS